MVIEGEEYNDEYNYHDRHLDWNHMHIESFDRFDWSEDERIWWERYLLELN